MAIPITQELKAKAEVYYGDEVSQERTRFLLKEVGLPTNLLPLKNIIECGYVEETGFVWLKQKKKIQHKFETIGKWVTYDTEVQAYAEKFKIKKLVGVKAKELLLWVTLSEISVDGPILTFKTPAGLFRTFPASAFEGEEVAKEVKQVEKPKEGKLGGLKQVEEPKEVKATKEVEEPKEGKLKETKEVEEPKEVKEDSLKETKQVVETKEVKEAMTA